MRYHSDSKSTEAQELLKSHWKDLAARCDRDQRPYFTSFISQEDVPTAEAIAQSAGVSCTAWGGVENATRVIVCFSPTLFPLTHAAFPLRCLTFSYRTAQPPKHQDFLGAMMACNIERNTIGDILIDKCLAQVFVSLPVSDVVLQEIRQIGSVGVHVTADTPICLSAQIAFCPLNGTVASLRADVMTAFVTHCSREKAIQLIRQGRVSCRHTTIETPSAQLQIGDVFSIRGYGKFRLDAVDGLTRKGRYHITILKYQ